MNSRQRRQFKRRWKYRVCNEKYDSVFVGDKMSWANETFGVHKYQVTWEARGYCFAFDDKEKAMQFALRWSGS